jgi:hypothetical protein
MGRVFVRLLTAIPLLFWVGTAAVAHFVHACVAAPVDVSGDLVTGDEAVQAATPEHPIALSEAGTHCDFDSGALVVHHGAQQNLDNPLALSAPSGTVREQVFASARLFANPPPTAA